MGRRTRPTRKGQVVCSRRSYRRLDKCGGQTRRGICRCAYSYTLCMPKPDNTLVYDCAIITTAGTTIHVHKRYSAFALLYSNLHHTLPSSVRSQLPPLPPRAPWAKYRPGFLEKRRRALQAWLSGVLLHPEIGGCAAARDWVVKG